MYRLRDFMNQTLGMDDSQIVSDELYCTRSNPEKTFLTNQMQDSLGGYTFTLVVSGWLTLVYSGHEITLTKGDLYTYAPGFPITVISASEDYRSIVLLADELTIFELPVVRSVIRAAYFPVVQLQEPKMHLCEEEARLLENRMLIVMDYLKSDTLFLKECLRTACTLFLLDLMNIMERTLKHPDISERTENLFIGFIRLLPHHFIEHHDLNFYAEQLCITTTHLSRIVRQITGRTVVDYINQLLLMEATWLLQSTELSIADIADRLHFSDQSSFGRFFTRLKGVSPKAYRMKR